MTLLGKPFSRWMFLIEYAEKTNELSRTKQLENNNLSS